MPLQKRTWKLTSRLYPYMINGNGYEPSVLIISGELRALLKEIYINSDFRVTELPPNPDDPTEVFGYPDSLSPKIKVLDVSIREILKSHWVDEEETVTSNISVLDVTINNILKSTKQDYGEAYSSNINVLDVLKKKVLIEYFHPDKDGYTSQIKMLDVTKEESV